MSEQPGAPESGQEPGQVPANSDQPEYITRQEAQELANQAFQRAQGLFVKGNQQTRDALQKLEQNIGLFKTAGVPLSPQQETALRNKAFEDAMGGLPGTPDQQGAQPAPEGQDEYPEDAPDIVALVGGWQEEIDREYGTSVEEDDPEVEQFKLTDENLTPRQFTQKYEQAVKAKAQRVGAQPPPEGQPNQQRAPSNLGGGGAAVNPVQNTTDTDELWNQAKQQGRV